MTDFKIDYSKFTDKQLEIMNKVESDGKQGLSCVKEIIDFCGNAKQDDESVNINKIFGLELDTKRKVGKNIAGTDTNFAEYAAFFNSLTYFKRLDIINNANSIGYEKLAVLEREINNAFEECKGYQLVNTRRDRFEDRTRFDFKEVHDDVVEALYSLNELWEKLEKAYDKAKGKDGSKPEQIDYEAKLREIEQNTLGESYESFIANNNLDFTKTITENDAHNPNYENSSTYLKAKAYVNAIKKLAREELQRARTDSGERLLEETVKYSNSAIELIDFDSNDITEESIIGMSSEIMRSAFIEAVSQEYVKTGIKSPDSDKQNKNKKYVKGSEIVIKTSSGVYNTNGTKK